ncbi:ribulokinase [Mycetocola sp. 2940]|uniref:ribulokinase n=1 Tax=Mycetocola sp. 2940 TaxID=3156452 RepID=UPI00339A4F0B
MSATIERPAVCTIGVDFGTESARAVVVDLSSGRELGECTSDYPSGVISDALPGSGVLLAADWALQDADDYLRCLTEAVTGALAASGTGASSIIGIAIDATACTIVPALADSTPLSRVADLRDQPHAWVKLWKHHAAQPQADRINNLAETVDDLDVTPYGGRVSSEWLLPKALQVFEEARNVFERTERFIEAQDWITWQLTGTESRSAQAAGFKANFRVEAGGYASASTLDALAPGFSALLDRLSTEFSPAGAQVGSLVPAWAEALGLPAGIAVATGSMDAQVTMVACDATAPGRMVLVMGTSVCNLLLSETGRPVAGVAGVVRDAIIPGTWAYEAGQAGIGDMFGWFVRNSVPASYVEQATSLGIDVFSHLESLATTIESGRNTVLALDWWSGNRSPLADSALSGAVIGYSLGTKPENVYRALLEAAAFGQRAIIDTFEAAGILVEDIVACGGLPHKSPLFMQLLADITGREIQVSQSAQAGALGAAIHAAVAAGPAAGGFASLDQAGHALGALRSHVYSPNPAATAAYESAYADYLGLVDYFGRQNVGVMHRLKGRVYDDAATSQ